MRKATISQQMPVRSSEVFELLHDYDRRLEWDTMLKKARYEKGNDDCYEARRAAIR